MKRILLCVLALLYLSGCGNSKALNKADYKSEVSEILLEDNKGGYLEGECYGEGNIILGVEENDGVKTVYALTMYGEYGFQDGNFVKVSGSGVIPAVITIKKDGWNVENPQDGAGYLESLKEMFPVKYHNDVLNPEKFYDELKNQEKQYALKYLEGIERTAEVGEYKDFEHILPDMNVECSNALLNEFNEYPYWIGNEEKIEDGVRVVYSKEWESKGNGDGIVSFVKTEYDTGKVLEKTVIEIKDGKMNYLEKN